MPFHADSGIFLAPGLLRKRARSHPRQAVQRLLQLSQAAVLRRSGHGAREPPGSSARATAFLDASKVGSMKSLFGPDETIFLPGGFAFSAVRAGIKASGRPDLATVQACPGTTAAAAFTRNR